MGEAFAVGVVIAVIIIIVYGASRYRTRPRRYADNARQRTPTGHYKPKN